MTILKKENLENDNSEKEKFERTVMESKKSKKHNYEQGKLSKGKHLKKDNSEN